MKDIAKYTELIELLAQIIHEGLGEGWFHDTSLDRARDEFLPGTRDKLCAEERLRNAAIAVIDSFPMMLSAVVTANLDRIEALDTEGIQ